METVPQRSEKLSRFWLLAAIVLFVVVLALILFGSLTTGTASNNSTVGLTQTPFVGLVVLSFISGMLGFVSPCTLPLLPAYFAITFQSERKQVLLNTIAFMGGLAITFAVFGAMAGIVGQSLNKIGLSRFELARIGGYVVIFFGVMSLLGKGFTGIQSTNRRKSTVLGSLVFGATFALGWTTCTGPVLGAITTLAINANFAVLSGQLGYLAPIFSSMLLLIVFAMGLGVPLIIVSTFFGRANRDSLFWRILRGKGWEVKILGKSLYIHSTTAFSGLLFIGLGILMASGRLFLLNNLVPDDFALKTTAFFAEIEDWLVSIVGR